MCIKLEVWEILFKLSTNDHSDEAFLLTSKFWPWWVVCLCPRAMYMYKIMKNMHKIRGQSYFLKRTTSDQSDDLSACIKKIVPKGCLVLPLGFIYIYEIKQNIIWNNEAKGIFLELVQHNGNNKSFEMQPKLVPSWLYAHALGLFSNDDPGLILTIFMTGSNLFLMLLYGWQLIEHWVLLYFQVCSNSAYPQHSGEQYRPMVF